MSNLVKPAEITSYLGSIHKGLSELVPTGIDASSWLKTVQLLLNDNEGIQKALQSPQGQQSLYHCLQFAASTGLSLNPQEGKAAIIAYGGKIQYQVMSKGMIEIAQRSGQVAYLGADTVRENDNFALVKTMDGDQYRHEVAITDRGPMLGYYAALKTKTGQCYVTYMTFEQVDEHKRSYAASKNGPWVNSFEGMALKTVLKRLLRNVNLSPELTQAIGIDDKEEASQSKPEPKYITAELLREKLTERSNDGKKDKTAENQSTDTELCLTEGSEGEVD